MEVCDKVQAMGKESKSHLECPICFNRFDEPKVLDCLHSICMKCLQDLGGGWNHPSAQLTCPLCGRETKLTENGVADLPDNFSMSALVEETAVQEQLREGQGSKIICRGCDEENQASSFCMECNHFVCQECHRAHKHMAIMRSHKVYSVAQLQSGDITYKSKLRAHIPKCGKHPNQDLEIYCITCGQLLCKTCSALDHEKHACTDLNEALHKCKKDIAELVAKAAKSRMKLSAANSETDKSRETLDTMFADTMKRISKRADEEIARIRQEEKKLKQEVEEIYKHRVQTYETVQAANSKEVNQIKQKLQEVKELIDQGSGYEIINLKQKISCNLKDLTEKRPIEVRHSLSFISFEEGERSLGTVVLENEQNLLSTNSEYSWAYEELGQTEKWKLKKQIKNVRIGQTQYDSLRNVVVFSNNEIVVGDSEHKQLISFLLKSKSQSVGTHKGLQIKELTDLISVSVNKDDQLIVLDSSLVKTFSREYQFLHQFKPGKDSTSKPTCLAVHDNNLIAVGYWNKQEISLHKPNGSLLRTVPAPMIGDYLTVCKQQYLYTAWNGKKLLSVDVLGGELFSVGIDNNSLLTGVCCDPDGSIYVAVNEKPKGEIYRFTPDGKYTGCTVKGCGSPMGITFTPNGELVVAAEDSIQVYQRE